MTILILGKGTLGRALHAALNDSILCGRPEFDLSTKAGCDLLVNSLTPTVVINTVAVNQTHDPWEILTTNFVSAAYLSLMFYNKMESGQIINISSTSTLWVSYPGIDVGRFCYNMSKESLSQFGRQFNRKIVDDHKSVVLTTLEIGKFASKFNNFQPGMPIEKVVGMVQESIRNPTQQVTVIK